MKIPSEHLVLGVFGAIGAAAYAGMSGGSSKKEKPSVDKVPLNAESAYVACLYTNNSDEAVSYTHLTLPTKRIV